MTLDISDVTYTEATLWEAIYVVLPTFKTAREGGAVMFAPTSLMHALLVFFVERETDRLPVVHSYSGIDVREDYGNAGRVLLRAYEDLNANGCFNYAE